MKRMDLALVDLSIIWLSVGGCIALFFPISTMAGALMLPYLAWCTLAWALNYSVWQLNMCVLPLPYVVSLITDVSNTGRRASEPHLAALSATAYRGLGVKK